MTLEQAKEIYAAVYAAGKVRGGCAHKDTNYSDDEWEDIHSALESIITATSDSDAARVIDWWGCWDQLHTPTAFARSVRQAWKEMK